jgi:hypothetical protein
MPKTENIWTSVARYCSELAPVVGPLLSAAAETADAIDRASSGEQRASRTVLPITYEDD